MYSNKKIDLVSLNAFMNGFACRAAKIVSGLLLAVVLCANISLKGADSRGEKRAREDSEGLMAIADARLSSELGVHALALLSFRNSVSKDRVDHAREAVSAVVVEGEVSEGVGSGKRKRNDTGGATGQPAAKRARDGEKEYVCGIGECEFKAAYSGSMKRHQAIHAGEKPFVCGIEGCRYGSVRLAIVETHRKTHIGERPFLCDFAGCDYGTVELGFLNEHRVTHTGEKPFVCGIGGCPYASAISGNTKTHRKMHTDEKPYVCGIDGCRYGSVRLAIVETHRKTHIGERLFLCDFAGCNYACTRPDVLELHTKRHANGRLFVCDFAGCNYAASQACGLKIHKRIHTGEKPYVCDFEGCGYKAGDLSGLRQHKQMHSDDRRFKCTVCDYEAKRKSHLDSHVKTKHTTKKNLFSCDFSGCFYTAANADGLESHRESHGVGTGLSVDGHSVRSDNLKMHTGEKPYVCGIDGCFLVVAHKH